MKITVQKNGPFRVEGEDIQITDPQGGVYVQELNDVDGTVFVALVDLEAEVSLERGHPAVLLQPIGVRQ